MMERHMDSKDDERLFIALYTINTQIYQDMLHNANDILGHTVNIIT
jgi:hypothetical protein